MANVNISDYKMSILLDIQNSDEIYRAIGSQNPEVHMADDLMYRNLWPFYQTGVVQSIADTHIMLKVDQADIVRGSDLFVQMEISLLIMANRERMSMRDEGIAATRIDYIAEAVRKLLNNSTRYGIGILKLRSNMEFVLSENSEYLCREMKFRTYDINDFMCGNGL
jgi:hypothetical protein